MDPLVGRRLGPYELQEMLGAGSFGWVYRAIHRDLDQPRAIKILMPNWSRDQKFVERFRAEARLAAGLDHPNVVPIYDIGQQDDVHFIVMRLLTGSSLRQLLRTEGWLAPARAAQLLSQLANALDHAHVRGIAHRDVKPDNAFVGPDDHVTLVDFGIARAAEGSYLSLAGTASYMAPETLSSKGLSGPVGARSIDLYALGITAYEMLAGRPPFVGDPGPILHAQVFTSPPSPRSFRPDLSERVEHVILRQLAKDPEARYLTAKDFTNELARAVNSAARGDVPTQPSGDVATLNTWAIRNEDGDRRASGEDESGTTRATKTSRATRTLPLRLGGMLLAGILVLGFAIAGSGWFMTPQSTPRVPPPLSSTPTGVAEAPTATVVPPVPLVTPATALATTPPTSFPAIQTTPPIATLAPPTLTPGPAERLAAVNQALSSRPLLCHDLEPLLAELDQIEQSDPNTLGLEDARANARILCARALLSQGDLDSSWGWFMAARDIPPTQRPDALEGLKQVILAKGWREMEAAWGNNDDAVIEALESIRATDANYRSDEVRLKLYAALISKADGLANAGKRDEAFKLFMRALEFNPNDPEVRVRLASYTPTPTRIPPTPIPYRPPVQNPPIVQPVPTNTPIPPPVFVPVESGRSRGS